jgi:hypothetical protein
MTDKQRLPHVDHQRCGGPCRPQAKRLVQSLDDGGVGHAAALTHRLQRVSAAALFQSVDKRRHDASAAGAQRMSDGDGAAIDVGLRQIGTGVLGPGQHYRMPFGRLASNSGRR